MESQIKQLAERAERHAARFVTPEATFHGLVAPLLQALGYDVFDPEILQPCVALVEGEVWYVARRPAKPTILLMCRALHAAEPQGVEEARVAELKRLGADLGLVTDGFVYVQHTPTRTNVRSFDVKEGYGVIASMLKELNPARQAVLDWSQHTLHFDGLEVDNFKSSWHIHLDVGYVTILTGANGSGKSNIIQSILFFSDVAALGLTVAIEKHGGLQGLLFRRSNVFMVDRNIAALDDYESIEIKGHLSSGYGLDDVHLVSTFGFSVKCADDKEYEVVDEFIWGGECSDVNDNHFESGFDLARDDAVYAIDRHSLSVFSHDDERVSMIRETIRSVECYVIDPSKLQAPHYATHGDRLEADGSNLFEVWEIMEREHSNLAARVCALLGDIVPGLESVTTLRTGDAVAMQATFAGGLTLNSAALSEGTLRALGLLVAVYQPNRPRLILLDEPETGLHPYAAGLLFEHLMSAPNRPQLVISTHSPAILDSSEVTLDMLRVVKWENGSTQVGPVSERVRQLVRDHLATGAELMTESLDGLEMEPAAGASEGEA